MASLTQRFGCCLLVMGCSSYAAAFEFDRPGEGMGTATTPVGQVAWEQGLPTVNYTEETVAGLKVKTTTLNAEALLRTGLTDSLEVQLGWDGPTWTEQRVAGRSTQDNGLGDVSLGLKKSIALPNEDLSMALLAQVNFATGKGSVSQDNDSYLVASALSYQIEPGIQTGIHMQYEWQDGDWAIVAIPNLSYDLSDRWTGFSEWIYRKAEGQAYESRLNSGIIYAWSERLQFDASLAVNIDGGVKQYTTGLGLSVLF